jgi:predicted TIM-barrel fold metal-dependent hydrolase
MNIDIHNHFYPKAYVNELSKRVGYSYVQKKEDGKLLIYYEGDYNIVVDSHIDIKERLKVMNRCGIDMQVLTLTTPGVEREPLETGIKLAEITNNEFKNIIEKYSERFLAFAALPLQNPIIAATELERAVKNLGLSGGTLMTNVSGKSLDSKDFLPIFEKAVELDVPLFIHPTSPINSKGMKDYRLVPIIGFGIDTSLTILRLVFFWITRKIA